MLASVRFGDREDEGPLLRAKSPVRLGSRRFYLGIAASKEEGMAVQAGGAVPASEGDGRWRVQSFPWSRDPRPSVQLKWQLKPRFLPVSIRVGGEVCVSDLATRISASVKPGMGEIRPSSHDRELVVQGHSGTALGGGYWAQARWEAGVSGESVLRGERRGWTEAAPWVRARLKKVKFAKMPDRPSAKQCLCQPCSKCPLVREQTPAVKGGLSLERLAQAYAGARIEDVSPPLRVLRRDLLTDLKAVTLAHWMLESDRGQSHLARHHCNYARVPFREELRHLGAEPTVPAHAQQAYCSFDGPDEFIRAFWEVLGREAFTHNSRALSLEPASSSDSACSAFLETLSLGGVIARPDQVAELIPEARRLLAQHRSSS